MILSITLDDLKVAAFKTIRQGKPSLVRDDESSDGWTCQYRAPDGCRCPIGWLIPDDKYHPKLEGAGAGSSSVVRLLGLQGKQYEYAQPTDPSTYSVAIWLQRSHDSAGVVHPEGGANFVARMITELDGNLVLKRFGFADRDAFNTAYAAWLVENPA